MIVTKMSLILKIHRIFIRIQRYKKNILIMLIQLNLFLKKIGIFKAHIKMKLEITQMIKIVSK